jgi:hypothetical protein
VPILLVDIESIGQINAQVQNANNGEELSNSLA